MTPVFDGTGKLNRYTCEECEQSIITIDREHGVTPYIVRCRATEGCDGHSKSAFYRGVYGTPSYEWRKPTTAEYQAMSPAIKEHVDMGGLEIYPIEPRATKPATKPNACALLAAGMMMPSVSHRSARLLEPALRKRSADEQATYQREMARLKVSRSDLNSKARRKIVRKYLQGCQS